MHSGRKLKTLRKGQTCEGRIRKMKHTCIIFMFCPNKSPMRFLDYDSAIYDILSMTLSG